MTDGGYTKEQILAMQTFPEDPREVHKARVDLATFYIEAVKRDDFEDADSWWEVLTASAS